MRKYHKQLDKGLRVYPREKKCIKIGRKVDDEAFITRNKGMSYRIAHPDRVEQRLQGRLHREDGPAVEHANGAKEWWFRGKLHREDGPKNLSQILPAIEHANGDEEWFLKKYHGETLERSKGRLCKTNSKGRLITNIKDMVEKNVSSNRVEYLLDGELHREDGPAIEHANGDKEWYLNGELHREDGPAIEHADGTKEWWLNGELHREDGPAIEHADGDKEWFLNGERHRVDGPAIEWANGDKEWYMNGELHREDGPAIEHANGDEEWSLNGERHRVDGPAIERADA
jgi:hypothetical protein